jgi:hypothetical protein
MNDDDLRRDDDFYRAKHFGRPDKAQPRELNDSGGLLHRASVALSAGSDSMFRNLVSQFSKLFN